MRRVVRVVSGASGSSEASAASARTVPGARDCPLFPASYALNRRVDRLPVATDSAAIVDSMGRDDPLKADFGSGSYRGTRIGIPYDVVGKDTPRTEPTFDIPEESDRVGYPIPDDVELEGGTDDHALLIDRDACRLYELFRLRREGGGWAAGSGATWDLRSTKLRPRGWTSADAAGLPMLPLLARPDEVRRGRIDHALRVTTAETRRAFVFPARHFASESDDPALPRMGERLRLRRGVRIAGFPEQARVLLRAMQIYGLVVADNGTNWFVNGVPSPDWDNDQLATLGRLRGSDFEVVDTARLR